MAVIEGYTFAVDMQDRGVVTTLRQMRAAASAMKAEMRTGFETIRQGEGSISAYNFKIQQSQRQIENYKNMQIELRKELDRLADKREKEIAEVKKYGDSNTEEAQKVRRAFDITEKSYASVARQIENTQHQVNKLTKGIKDSREAILQFNTGLERARAETAGAKSVMENYVRSINGQGRAFATTKAQAQSYRAQHRALINQFRAEVTETSRLKAQTLSLRSSYSQQQASVTRAAHEHGRASDEYKREASALAGLREKITQADSQYAKQISTALRVKTSIGEISRAERSITDGGITRLSRAMNNLDANARRATSHTREWAASLRSGFATAAFAVAPLELAVGKSVQMASDMQAKWITTKNLLVTGGEKVGEVTKSVGQMQRDASKYSREYGISQKDIADQYTELVKRGYSSKASLGSMKSMLEATRASGDDFSDVVRTSSQVLDAFGLQSSHASVQMAHTKQVVNAMAYSADMTATSFKDLGVAMGYVSASASQAGFTVEQTTAAVGILSNSGVEGSRAGTSLRKVINSLLKPTRDAQAALKGVGLSVDDFRTKSGALKSLPQIFRIIEQHTARLGKADKGAFFKALFGATGQQAGTILAQSMSEMAKGNKNLGDLTKNIEKAEKGNGYVHKLAIKNMQSTQMQMQKLKMNIQDIAINMGKSLLPVVNQVATAFSNWLGSKDGQKALKDFSDNVSGLGRTVGHNSKSIIAFLSGFVEGLSGVVKFSGKVIGLFAGVADAIGKVTGASKLGNGVPKFIGETTGAILGLVGAYKIWKTTVDGRSAIRQDLKNVFRLDGMDQENSKIGHENQELQENIRLWERHNEVSGGDSAVGSDITPSTSKEGKTSEISAVSGKSEAKESAKAVEREAGPAMEKAGTKSAGFFSHGFGLVMRKVGRWGADALIQTFTLGILDFDMVKAIGGKVTSAFKSIGHKIKGIKIFPNSRSASAEGSKTGDAFAKGVSRGAKRHSGVGTRALKNMFGFSEKDAKISGEKTGASYAEGVNKAASRGDKKISTKKMFRGTTEEAKSSGTKAGSNFAENVTRSATKGNKRISGKELFRDTAKEASESGAKTGTSFISRLGQATRSSKLMGMGRFIGTRMGGAATVAFGAIDLFAELGSSSKKNRAKVVGQSLGTTIGGAAGAGLGATVGSVFGPVGTLIGSVVGGAAGGTIGRKIGGAFGKLWPKIKKGAVIAFKGIGKVIAAPFEWASKRLNKFGSSLKKKMGIGNRRKSTIGAGNYSAKDRQLVQKMTKAVNGYARSLKALKKVNMRNYFRNMGREIQKSKLPKELMSLDRSTRQSAKNWRNLAKPMRTVTIAFRSLQRAVKNLSGRRNGFSALNRDIQTLYRTIRRNPFGKLIAQQANIANRALSGKKSGFVNEFNRQTRSMERSLRSFRRTFTRDWEDTWRGLARPVSRNLGEANRAERRSLNDMSSERSRFSSSFLKGWDSWIDSVVSNFRKGFDKLPGYAQSSMKDIISRLNKGISGINSTISSFGGDKKLSSISYANGTQGGHPGGHMLVNDSVRPHWKELVLFPNGQALLPQHRNTLIPNAPRGTQVLSGENTYKFMNSIGVHKYANGTLSDEEMDKLSEQFEKHPEQASKELILKLTNWNSKVPVVADFGEASAVAFSRGIANKLKDLIGAVKQPVNGDWTPVIRSAAAKMGVSLSAGDISHIITVIMGESGGIQNRRQEVDDVNMREGHPAQGLLQYVPSTFDHYAVAGHHNINSGYDQLLAMFNDATWRSDLTTHGWSPNGPRRMAWGGFANKEQLIHVAEGNLPEAIIPFDINKRPRALSLIDHTLDKMENDGGGTGGLRSRASQARMDNENTTYLKQVVSILAQIAGLNKQQIDAILTHGNDDMDSRHKRAQFYQKFGNDQRVSDYMSY